MAVKILEGLIRDGFDHEKVRYNYALALNQVGDLDGAISRLKSIIEESPSDASLTSLGVMLLEKGDFGQAEDVINQALKINPKNYKALSTYSLTRKMNENDAAWKLMVEDLLSSNEVSRIAKAELMFALGKYHDDLKNYDEAFISFERANKIKKSLVGQYIQSDVEEHFEKLKALVGIENSGDINPYKNCDVPLYVLGMPRSGTTLVEQILSGHPDIHGAGELMEMNDIGFKCLEQLSRGIEAVDFAELSGYVYENIRRKSENAKRVIDKMPGNFKWVGLISKLFPSAKIIHVVRNPLDTCLSIYFQNFNSAHNYACDMHDLAHYYAQYHKLMTYWESVLPKDTMLTIHYETLIDNQAIWIDKMFKFMGLDPNDRCEQFWMQDRKVSTASNWQARQPIYKTSKERWRNYEKHVGPLLPLLELYKPERGQNEVA